MHRETLEFAVREAKDVLDYQFRAQELQFERADSLVRVALAESAALGALVGYLFTRDIQIGAVSAMVVATSAVLNFGCLVLLTGLSLAGRRQPLRIGPDLAALAGAVVGGKADLMETLGSAIQTLAAVCSANARLLERRFQALGFGLITLVGAGTLLLASIVLIAWRTIQ